MPPRYSRMTTPKEDDGDPAAQGSEGRCCEIHECRVPSGREVLEVLQGRGVQPETADDPGGASALRITPSTRRASPIRERIIKDCAPRNPDIVVGNSWSPIGTAIEAARSRMRGMPARTATTRHWAPVRAAAVPHRHHARHRTCRLSY